MIRLWFLPSLLAVPAQAAAPAPAAATPAASETWIGHEILLGHVNLPLLGKMDTRTDNYVIAHVTRHGDSLHLVQVGCGSHTKPVLGSSVTLPDSTVAKLPATTIDYHRAGGWLVASPWVSGWGNEDIDGDGHPGVTYDVNAPLCGGQLYAAVHNVAMARAREEAKGRIVGEVKIRASQTVLGTSGACLAAFAGDRREELHGTFAYEPATAGATCESQKDWPDAPDPVVQAAR